MQGFKGATTTTTTTIPGMNGSRARRARPPTHSRTGDTPRNGAHIGTGRGVPHAAITSCGVRMAPGHADMGGSALAAHSRSSAGHRGVAASVGSTSTPPTPYKGMVWRSISDFLLYNMRGFKGAIIIIIIINPWYERKAGAPAHSFQHRRYAS